MSETKWPAGEWRAEWTDASQMFEIGPIGDDGEIDWSREIATTVVGNYEQQHAVADLIAAAPDLYEALADVTDLLRAYAGHVRDGIADVAIARALAALARARGEADHG